MVTVKSGFLFSIFFTITISLFGQKVKKPTNFYAFGFKTIYINLEGDATPFDTQLSETRKSALLKYGSVNTLGINFETHNHFKRKERWTFVGELGLYQVGGNVSFKKLGGSFINGSERYQSEFRRMTQFKSTYINTACKFQYVFNSRHNLSIVFGPKLAGRVLNKVTSNTNSYIQNREFDPEFNVYKSTNTRDSDDDLVPLQLITSFGLYKSFLIDANKIIIGLEYERSLLNIHNAGGLKAHMISFGAKYGLARRN